MVIYENIEIQTHWQSFMCNKEIAFSRGDKNLFNCVVANGKWNCSKNTL